jgi:hypothetical protein
LTASKLPQPSFAIDAPPNFPVDVKHVEIHAARRAAMDAAKALYDLLWGPEERIMAQLVAVGPCTCLNSHLGHWASFSLL